MKKVEIGDNQYDLPESWSDITVKKFEEIVAHTKNLAEYKSDILFALEMFSILLEAPLEEVKKLNKDAFQFLSDTLEWANSEVPNNEAIETYEIDGEVWMPIKDLGKLTMGEVVDLELILKNSTETNVLSNLLPLLIRKAKPKTSGGLKPGDFNLEDYEEIKEKCKTLKVTEVIHLKSFF